MRNKNIKRGGRIKVNGGMELKQFSEINLSDKFFDYLKEDYKEFESWVIKKKDRKAYVLYDKGYLQGFLYLKMEFEEVIDVEPVITADRILKVGTFKINAHGTKLGERFIKKLLDYAVINIASICYVTVFEKHELLIKLLKEYGFKCYGNKTSQNGIELVLVKDMKKTICDLYKDFPLIRRNTSKYLLAVYPQYHTQLFPDSILKTESVSLLEDVSHTNSIHKAYVARMEGISKLNKGDLLVIYRTKDYGKSAEYSSVATSICTVESVRHQSVFKDFNEFYEYTSKYSVFDKGNLNMWYNKGGCYVIKMLYNTALTKRLIRQRLADECGLNRDEYWGILELSNDSFNKIVELGGVNESIIVD